MPSPSADWLMHLFSGYYPSSHGPEMLLLLGPLTLFVVKNPFHFAIFISVDGFVSFMWWAAWTARSSRVCGSGILC